MVEDTSAVADFNENLWQIGFQHVSDLQPNHFTVFFMYDLKLQKAHVLNKVLEEQ